MTALLTDNLPLMAGAPSGIKKLRELILELAVRGKLVPQDPSDEPASELLKRIAEKKTRLAAEGRVKKQKLQAGGAGELQSFDLPKSWEWIRISDLLPDFQNGVSSRGESDGVPVTVLRLADIREGEVSLEGNRALTLTPEVLDKYALEYGDVLVIRVNGSSDLVGRFAVCRSDLQAIPCDHFIRMRFLGGSIDSAYLKIVGDSQCVRSAIAVLFVSTAGQKTVNQAHIGSLSLPFPPLHEQQRIVAKVDELMALCDRLEAQQDDAAAAHAQLVQTLLDSLSQAQDADDFAACWQRLAKHFHTLLTTESSIDPLKQTLMQLAVMGKLVPQEPSDGSARDELERISQEKAKSVPTGRRRRQELPATIEDDEQAFKLPRGWAWARLGDLVNVLNGRAYKKEELLDRGTPVLRVGNLFTSNHWYYSNLSLEEDKYCNPGDLLFAWSASFGPFIWSGERVIYHYHIWKLDLYAEHLLNMSYLYNFLLQKTQEIKKSGHGIAMVHMTKEKMERLVVPVPPLAEQHRIVAKLDQLMALCDGLKAGLSDARQLHERLADALVGQAVA